MKKSLFRLIAVISVLMLVVCCGNRRSKKAEAPAVVNNDVVETCFTAVEKYLIDSIATHYAASEFCIPFQDYAAVDESDPEDIVILGDFWVINYDQAGDTLKAVSGGNHPGKMHVKKDADGHFTVTAFEPVGDGSNFEPSARALFGDKYDALMAAHADDVARASVRTAAVSAYVNAHDLPVRFYQDYGWPAVELPEVEDN